RREQQLRFDCFRRHYNEERPHEGLAQQPPARFYQPSPRPYPVALREPEYGDGFEGRRVRHDGGIKWRGTETYLSETLAGEPVGVQAREDGSWEVYFGELKLGSLDIHGRFHRERRAKPSVSERCGRCYPCARSKVL